MAISLRVAGALTAQTAAPTAVNPAYGAGVSAGDISILAVYVKPYTTTITTPAGWTKLGEKTSGTRAGAPNAGSVKVAMYYKMGAGSGSIGNLTLTGATDGQACIISYQCGAGETFATPTYTDGADTTVGTNYSAVGAANLSLVSGDWLLAACCATDVQGSSNPGAEALFCTGATFGTLSIRREDWCQFGDLIWSLFWDRPVTGGPSTAGPTMQWTWASATQEGATGFVRLSLATSTPKNDADTATGTDSAGSVTGYYVGTETGSGTDNAGSVARASSSTDTATGTDNAGTVVRYLAGSDTASGIDSAGSVAQYEAQAGSDTGTATDSAGSVARSSTSADTATGTDAGTVARASQDADLGTAADNAGTVRQGSSETASGTDSSGTLSATVPASDSSSATEAVSGKTFGDSEAGTGLDNAGHVTQFRAGTDTGVAVDGDYLTVYKTTAGETSTSADTHTNRRFDGQSDDPTIVEGETQSVLLPQNKAGSDTSTGVEGQTLALPGTFSQIPVPKVWSNGDNLDAGTLNKEWRDAFSWLLRKTSPGFEGYNSTAPAITFTSGVAIPITAEVLKRGNVQHAANDTKVYVYETGWYFALVQIGVNTSSVTADTGFASVLKKNGLLESSCETTRVSGTLVGIEHLTSVFLTAGDYVEIAVTGTWTGTALAHSNSLTTFGYSAPYLNLWWRNN